MHIYQTQKQFTFEEAMKVAEALYTETKGMFACFEGEVYVFSLPVYLSSSRHYEVALISASCVSGEELKEACLWVGLPFLYKSRLNFTSSEVKWERYN